MKIKVPFEIEVKDEDLDVIYYRGWNEGIEEYKNTILGCIKNKDYMEDSVRNLIINLAEQLKESQKVEAENDNSKA